MVLSISTPLFLIFLFLSGIHIYWLSGGKWGSTSVYPTINDKEKPVMPGPVPTLTVAAGLLFFAFIVVLNSGLINTILPKWLAVVQQYGLWFITSIFLIRAIGDFNYLGFFKKVKQTKFGINDSKYYSPLCLIISILSFVLILLNEWLK